MPHRSSNPWPLARHRRRAGEGAAAAMLPGRPPPASAGRPDRPRRRGLRLAGGRRATLMMPRVAPLRNGPRRALRRARALCAGRPGRCRRGAIARRMTAAVMPFARRDVHHADGGGRRRGRRGGPGVDAGRGQARARLRQQWRRHRAPPRAGRSLHGRPRRPARPPGPVRRRRASRPRIASRGIATSGWRGRSFSLGIADAVTVLAETAAQADAAATDHRQRGRPARTSGRHAPAGARRSSPTATSATAW